MASEAVTLVAHDTTTVSFTSEDREGLTERAGKQQFSVMGYEQTVRVGIGAATASILAIDPCALLLTPSFRAVGVAVETRPEEYARPPLLAVDSHGCTLEAWSVNALGWVLVPNGESPGAPRSFLDRDDDALRAPEPRRSARRRKAVGREGNGPPYVDDLPRSGPADVALERADGDDAHGQASLLPLLALEDDLGDLSRRLAESVLLHRAPVGGLDDGANQIRGEPSLDDEMSARATDRLEDLGAVAGSVDANHQAAIAPDCGTDAVDLDADALGVFAAKPAITGTEHRADGAARFGDAGEQRVVARAPLVARIGAGQRSLLVAEQWLDRRVHVQMHGIVCMTTKLREPVLRHDELELCKLHFVEPAQISVHGIDARNRATGELHEQRVGTERFEAEDAPLADDIGVEQEAELRIHRIHDPASVFDVPEPAAEFARDSEPLEEHPERHQPADRRERSVARPAADPARVSPTDPPPPPLQLVTTCPLVSERPSAHLVDARLPRLCRSHQLLRRARRAPNSRAIPDRRYPPINHFAPGGREM